jgi:GR25 family glycosyltransferase involved in LPS biosynthesis
MDRCTERLALSESRIRNAGFKNVHRHRAVDGKNEGELQEAWARHGNPLLNMEDVEFVDTYKHGKQGCSLSHFDVWKDIVDNSIPYAIIFEDDVEFHKDFATLAPTYWLNTPKDFDVLYMGSQIDM